MSKKPLGGLGRLINVDDRPSTESVDPSHTLAPRPAPVPTEQEEEVRSIQDTSAGKVARRRTLKNARPKLRKEGFLVHPTAKMQFDMLKAQLKSQHRGTVGPWLLNEALNLLFRKYGKPTVDLEEPAER